MKGLIFTEFLAMVEEIHSLDMVDEIIDNCDLPSGGAYTTVGTYDHTEIVALVCELSTQSGVQVNDLLKAFGTYLFTSLSRTYPEFVSKANDPLNFLEEVETYIHIEVKKLYPEAELPTFYCSRPNSQDELHMIYESMRHMEDVCEGLIIGCMKHFGQKFTLAREKLPDGNELFILKKLD